MEQHWLSECGVAPFVNPFLTFCEGDGTVKKPTGPSEKTYYVALVSGKSKIVVGCSMSYSS